MTTELRDQENWKCGICGSILPYEDTYQEGFFVPRHYIKCPSCGVINRIIVK